MSELFFTGEKKKVTLPSGRVVTIRQHNGEDEGILSDMETGIDGSSMINYLCSIITGDSEGKKVTPDQLSKWGIKDKYYLAFVARVHSLGKIMKFSHTLTTTTPQGAEVKITEDYEEDLSIFMHDFSTYDFMNQAPFEKTHAYQITPYPSGLNSVIKLTLSSGKEVRWRIIDSELEKESLARAGGKANKNTDFIDRKLEVFMNNEWKYVEKFSIFGPKDMVELRNSLEKYDKLFEPISEFTSLQTKQTFRMSLMTNSAFFYPVEI